MHVYVGNVVHKFERSLRLSLHLHFSKEGLVVNLSEYVSKANCISMGSTIRTIHTGVRVSYFQNFTLTPSNKGSGSF